jgi:RecB family exonuclease
VITPRTTRLVRVRDLRAMHDAIARITSAVSAARTCAVLVPTRGAGEELRRTIENRRISAGAAILLPDILTREDFYARLHERLPGAPVLLSEFEREVLLYRAARSAAAAGAEPPFQLRPGLIAAILGFHDELRRRNRTLDDFERLMVQSLEPSADVDRGAERMLRQTHFLAAALAAYERSVTASGRIDEHGLRSLLLSRACVPPYAHVVVTVADQAADTRGLWPADFDLLTRMPAVTRLDVVATEALLATGFLDRLHAAHLPGIEEEPSGAASPLPVLAAPEPAEGDEPKRWFVYRDREEELAALAREIKTSPEGTAADRAVVFQRPLPYLYLARQVFADAALPYRALDSLPLAGEPFVAALDLVFTFLIAEGTRGSLVALLRSPHWCFAPEAGLDARSTAAADDLLQEIKYLGDFERLSRIVADARERSSDAGARGRRAARWRRALPALVAADAAATALRGIAAAATASAQVGLLIEFITQHERQPSSDDVFHARHMRARAAVLAALEMLREAHAAHDDERLAVPDLVAKIRRWIEGQTFSPRTGAAGVRLLDAHAAAYADIDELRFVGLVETDWPERSRRSIFYPSSLLTQLGWPADADRLSAARARFQDLLTLPKARVSLSAFTLEDDAIVPASTFLDDIEAVGLPVERVRPRDDVRVLTHEAIAEEPIAAEAVAGPTAEWLTLRLSRTPGSDAAFHGAAGARRQPIYSVSYVEHYLDCPFKYFATHVLQLPEERADETGLTPQERGQFLHDVFREFFAQWHAAGRRAITLENVGDALALFEQVTEERLLTLSEADRPLERTHLLGSAASPGLAERAFGFEIDHGVEVVERLLEHELEGPFSFTSGGVTRTVPVKLKADRIDLLTDGTLRVIDYKLGRAPKTARSLQLPIYGVCAEQQLKTRDGRDWKLSRAAYVAFRERNAYVPLGSPIEDAIAVGQVKFLETIDAIETGAFPVDPEEPYRCQWCAYPAVCRKDYVGDE